MTGTTTHFDIEDSQAAGLLNMQRFDEIFVEPKCKITVRYQSGLTSEAVFKRGDKHGIDTRLAVGDDRVVGIRSEVVR